MYYVKIPTLCAIVHEYTTRRACMHIMYCKVANSYSKPGMFPVLHIIYITKEQTLNESLTSRTNRNTKRTTHPTRK